MRKYLPILLLLLITASCDDEYDYYSPGYSFVKFYGELDENRVADMAWAADGHLKLLATNVNLGLSTPVLFSLNHLGEQEDYKLLTNDESVIQQSSVLVQSSDGGMVVACDDGASYLLIKLNKDGTIASEVTLTTPQATSVSVHALEEDYEGNLMVLTTARFAGNTSLVQVDKVNKQASTLIWRKRLGISESNYTNTGVSLVRDAGQDTYTILWNADGSDSDIRLTRMDRAGGLIWDRTLPGVTSSSIGEEQVAKELIKKGTDYLVLGQYQASPSTRSQIYIIEVSAAGEIVSEHKYGLASGSSLSVARLTVTGSRSVAVVGSVNLGSSGELSDQIFLAGITLDSDVLDWQETYGYLGTNTGVALVKASDGGFFIAGTASFVNRSMVCLIKTDAQGRVSE